LRQQDVVGDPDNEFLLVNFGFMLTDQVVRRGSVKLFNILKQSLLDTIDLRSDSVCDPALRISKVVGDDDLILKSS
jgi:hypothetical protein